MDPASSMIMALSHHAVHAVRKTERPLPASFAARTCVLPDHQTRRVGWSLRQPPSREPRAPLCAGAVVHPETESEIDNRDMIIISAGWHRSSRGHVVLHPLVLAVRSIQAHATHASSHRPLESSFLAFHVSCSMPRARSSVDRLKAYCLDGEPGIKNTSLLCWNKVETSFKTLIAEYIEHTSLSPPREDRSSRPLQQLEIPCNRGHASYHIVQRPLEIAE